MKINNVPSYKRPCLFRHHWVKPVPRKFPFRVSTGNLSKRPAPLSPEWVTAPKHSCGLAGRNRFCPIKFFPATDNTLGHHYQRPHPVGIIWVINTMSSTKRETRLNAAPQASHQPSEWCIRFAQMCRCVLTNRHKAVLFALSDSSICLTGKTRRLQID